MDPAVRVHSPEVEALSAPGHAAAARVLFVTAAGDRGGAEVAMERIASRLEPARYVPVMAAPNGSPLLAAWRSSGFEVSGTPPIRRLRSPIDARRAVEGIASTVRTAGIALVYTHGVAAQVHGGLAAWRAGRPAVAHAHDMFDFTWTRNGLLHRIARAVPRAATIADSAAVAKTLAARQSSAGVDVIPPPVEDALVPAIDYPRPLVLWCGRLQRWKGCHLFLDAARRVLDARADARFVVVGGTAFGLEPEYAEALRRQAGRLSLGPALEFAGQVPDARPWLRAAAVFVHSSEQPEPFGLAMAEAMIQERPVVAFRHGGAEEIVVDGETGRLVPPGDSGALARAILDLLGDDRQREAMGVAGRRRAIERFAADVIVPRVQAVYDRVLTGRAQGSR